MIKKKKIILYIISTLAKKGPTNQLFGLIKYLDKEKYNPHILTLSPEKQNSRLEDFIKIGVKVDSLNLSRISGIFIGLSHLRKKLRIINPDLIHTQGIRADNMLLKFSNKYYHCNTIRNYAFHDYVMKFGKITGILYAINHIKVIKNSNNPIACSKSIAELIKKEQNVTVDYIQNGIDHELYSPAYDTQKEQTRKKLDIDLNKRIFISSGSLITRKNHIVLIKAFNKTNISKNAQLIIIGDGNLKTECETQAEEGVLLRGKVDNVADYLKASDIFISASKSEGLPNSVLEALGTGLPVILSNIESHLEILEKNNEIGDTFSVGNVDELSELIKKYVNLDICAKSKKAREILCENFSASIMSKKYQKKYCSILNNDRN